MIIFDHDKRIIAEYNSIRLPIYMDPNFCAV